MSKKVLVIEDWEKFIDEVARENDIDYVTALDASLTRRCSPGPLLASFKGYTDKMIMEEFLSEKDEGQLFQMWKRKNVCGADMDGPFRVLILEDK